MSEPSSEENTVSGEKTSETETQAAKPKRRWLRWLLLSAILMIVLVAALAAGAYYFAREKFTEPGPTAEDQIFMLERGKALIVIARELEQAGLITDQRIFRLTLQLQERGGRLKAGEYFIPASASMEGIAAILEEGKSILHKITVAEGLTSFEIMALVEADPVLVGDMPELPAEGTLLPETYLFTRGMSRGEIVTEMTRAHDEVVARLWTARADDLPISTAEEAVILASIVEKETGLAVERPRVAAVFVNRLRIPMRLQSDPTIIYGITEGKAPLGRPIRRSEIDRETAYNTYQIDGLPPTPIANPGEAAIAAVLNPPATKDLYFVADGTGGHAFASSLAEHQRNVAKWRRIERARQQ
ncbi:MAG: endolytic transglycosylase MltG [Parvibaculum sp.]